MSIARNSLYNLAGSALPLVVSIITVPLYLKAIGVERYGVLAVCWLLVGYFGLFEFGLGTAIGQRIAAAPDETPRECSQLLASALALSLGLGAAGGLILFLGAKALLMAFHPIAGSVASEVARSAPWLGVAMPLTTSSTVLNGALIGRKRFLEANFSAVIINVASSIAPLITALTYSPQLPPVIATVVAVKVAGNLLQAWQVRVGLQFKPAGFAARAEVTKLVRFGGWVAASNVVTPVLLAMEKLIIPWKLGSELLSIYIVPYNLTSRYTMIPQGVRLAALPDFSVLEHDEVRALEERAQTALCTLTAPICIAGIIALPIVIPLWVGKTVGLPANPIAIILLAGFWWNGCSHIPYARLQGIGRPDLITKISLLQLAPYALAVLIAVEKFGIDGAALAWSCRAFLEAFIFFLAARNFRSLVRISAPLGLMVTLSAGLSFVMPPASVAYIVAQLALLAMTGFGAARLLATRYRGVYSAFLSGRPIPASEN